MNRSISLSHCLGRVATWRREALVVLIASFAAVVLVRAWTDPTCAPPACNAPTPLNTSSTEQTKVGRLGLGEVSDAYGDTLRIEKSHTISDSWRGVAAIIGKLTGSTGAYSGDASLDVTTENSVTGAAWTESFAVYANAKSANDADSQDWVVGLATNCLVHPSDACAGITINDDNNSTGGTIYGLHIDLSDTDVNRWGIFQNTPNNNSLAGKTTIGASGWTPATTLHVRSDASNKNMLLESSTNGRGVYLSTIAVGAGTACSSGAGCALCVAGFDDTNGASVGCSTTTNPRNCLCASNY